jgi:hypothetical protein
MWLDASKESEFAKMFNLEEADYPNLVILNPGKRKRFLVHGQNINEKDVSNTLDKILGGDAKFVNVKGGELPKLVSEYKEEKK